jgi:aryl-alcohol dehydrogenase-like predicted oxidoreductase
MPRCEAAPRRSPGTRIAKDRIDACPPPLRPLGRSGLSIAPLVFGGNVFGWTVDEATSFSLLDAWRDAGFNFIDTADVYNGGESERIVGKTLQELGAREQVFLATKVYNRTGPGPNEAGASRYHIIKACEDSLRRLRTDYIDLYQLHRPPPPHLPQDETLRALEDLVRAGKVLYIGSSTYPAWMIMEALAISERFGWVRYASEQPPYNLLDRRVENELIPLCQKYGLAVLPWSPLAMGVLAGRYNNPQEIPSGSRRENWKNPLFDERITRAGIEVGRKLGAMAAERGISSAQLALLWLKDQPGVTAPIIGPRTLRHLEDFIPVMEMSLPDADRPLFDALVHPGNAVADFYNSNDWMKARIVDPPAEAG